MTFRSNHRQVDPTRHQQKPTLSLPLLALAAWVLAACGGETAQPDRCTTSGEKTKGSVVTFATFARVVDSDKGIAEGVDIDGHASQQGDAPGCYKQDFQSPDGRPGIDNELATLLPLVEEFVGDDNIDALLTAAIANGQLLIMFAVHGVDDPRNDDCVDVQLGAGSGSPFLDTNGDYEPYQTFGFDRDAAPVSTFARGSIRDGVLVARADNAVLPVRILDADFNLELRNAKLRFEVTPDPAGEGIRLSGIASGGVHVDTLKDIISELNVGGDVIGAVLPILSGKADLLPNEDDICDHISAALKLNTTEAFLLGNE